MDRSDLERLLEPLSEEEPCGPDLEYDGDFGEMERAAQGKPEQQYGDTIVPAEPPDWKDLKKRAESLLDRTKDMRVVTYWSRAALHLEGLTALQTGMELLRGYVENFWPSVFPELDHDDNDDPTYRTNTLVSLCDEETWLRELRYAPLVSSRAVGQFSLKDVHSAADPQPTASKEEGGWGDGEGEETKSSGPSQASIDAAFSDADVAEIQQTEEATRLAGEHLTAVEEFVTSQVGVGMAVSLLPIRNLLSEMNQVVVAQLERRGVYAEAEEPAAEEDASGWGASEESGGTEAGNVAAAPAAAQGYSMTGKISTRKQAIKALDDVCDFYEENEPSSPLPLLIRRAQRLASKSFIDILRDLAPDAVSQAEALGGSGASDSAAAGSWGSEAAESTETTEESSGW